MQAVTVVIRTVKLVFNLSFRFGWRGNSRIFFKPMAKFLNIMTMLDRNPLLSSYCKTEQQLSIFFIILIFARIVILMPLEDCCKRRESRERIAHGIGEWYSHVVKTKYV